MVPLLARAHGRGLIQTTAGLAGGLGRAQTKRLDSVRKPRRPMISSASGRSLPLFETEIEGEILLLTFFFIGFRCAWLSMSGSNSAHRVVGRARPKGACRKPPCGNCPYGQVINRLSEGRIAHAKYRR